MKKLTLCFLLIILAAGCGKDEKTHQAPVVKQQDTKSILNVEPNQIHEFFKEKYRLKPDNRFVKAFGELYHFYTGKKGVFHIQKGDKKWDIMLDHQIIGSLSQHSDFSEAMKMLHSFSSELHQKYSGKKRDRSFDSANIEKKIQQFFPVPLLEALSMIDQSWERKTEPSAPLHLSVKALSRLSFQCLDDLELSDNLYAKNMALLAALKTHKAIETPLEESMLSFSMGYISYAIKTAESLPKDHPFNHYLKKDEKALSGICKNTSDPMTRFLLLCLTTEKRNEQKWTALREKLFSTENMSLSILKEALNMRRFTSTGYYSEILPSIICEKLIDVTKNRRSHSVTSGLLDELAKAKEQGYASLIHYFETRLSDFQSKKYSISGNIINDFFRGYFYSGLYRQGMYLLDSQSSIPLSEDFISRCGSSSFIIPEEFIRHYSNLVQFKKRTPQPLQLITSIKEQQNIRGDMNRRLFKAVQDKIRYGDPKLFKAVHYFVYNLDDRPSNKRSFTISAIDNLMDLHLAESLMSNVMRISSPLHDPLIFNMYYRLNQNYREVQNLLSLKGISENTRSRILESLVRDKRISYNTSLTEFEKLIHDNPDSWQSINQFSTYLKDQNQTDKAIQVIHTWIDSHDESQGFDYINANKKLANFYLLRNNPKAGLKIIDKVVGSGQAGCFETKARLLSRMGQKENAIIWAKKAIERYPYLFRSRVVLAEIYWGTGMYEKATLALKEFPVKYKSFDWKTTLSPVFYKTFRERGNKKTIDAYTRLVAAQIGVNHLQFIPHHFAANGYHQTAFLMQSQLRKNGLNQLDILITAYTYLKQWKGEKAALKWLKEKTPQQYIGAVPIFVFQDKEYPLLWDWLEILPKKIDTEYLWLMRAAAALKSRKIKQARWEGIVKYYAKDGSSHYHRIGQYLTNRLGIKEIFKLMNSPKRKCEISFFIGLKHEGSGDYYSASDWYRICLETGQNKNGEYHWARQTINQWALQSRFLSQIKPL